MFLDVTRLPRIAEHHGANEQVIDLGILVQAFRQTMQLWMSQGLVSPADSFGFALAAPEADFVMYDKPYDFVKLVFGSGDHGDRYIANAVRKLRATLRTGQDTLRLRAVDRSLFSDTVASVEQNGKFLWGDFDRGGATVVRVGQLRLPCAVSCFTEAQDDFVAKAIGGLLGSKMIEYGRPGEDVPG